MRAGIVVCLLFGLMAFCAPARDAASDERSIDGAIGAFVKAFERSDIDGLMQAYSDDLIYMPEGVRTEIGKAQTRQAFEKMFERYSGVLKVRTDEIVVIGDYAYDRGEVELNLTSHDGSERRQIHRRFLEIWRREWGSWKIIRVMNNKADTGK